MTRKEPNKILDAKIESNINQYKVDRLNVKISAFSSGDLNKYEFLKRIDLTYKPNALDKARFEFSPLGKTFSTGLDKTAQGYQEEGITKLLKDIRDSFAGNVIIPARPPRPNDNGNDDGNDNGNDKKIFIDLLWINDLHLYKKIASEVFSRYNGDKDSFELFTLRTFIDNINNERVKNKKDAREEFKIVKKNVKSEALKEIVKDLEEAIFGDDDNDEDLLEEAIFGDDDNDEDLLEAEELDRRLTNLISKKCRESLREYLKESEDANPQDRVNALRKKLNNLPKKSDDNDDNEDNQINNFVDSVLKKVSKEILNDDNDDSEDKVLKKVSKEIVNDDNGDNEDKVFKKVSKEIVNDDNKDNGDSKNDDNISLKSNQKSRKNITEQLKSSENLLDKEIRDAKKILELAKKRSELNAKSIAETNKMVEELRAKNKDREEYGKKVDKILKEYYTKEAQSASKEVEKFNKMINNDLDMSSEKSEIINKLIELYSLRQIYYLNQIDNSKANEKIDNVSLFSEISKLEIRLRELRQKGSGMFTSQKEFAKLLTFLAQLHAGNNSKKLKNNINQLLNHYIIQNK